MANTESKKKARERYNKTVKKVAADVNNDIYNIMQQYCINNDFTKKEFLEKAILYYIDRHWQHTAAGA